MDRSEYLREIKENIEYPFLCQQFNADDVDEVVGLMADVMCSTQSTVRIGGENIPLPQVQARFYRLDYSLMVYVFECLRRNTTQVRNIRAYLLTTRVRSVERQAAARAHKQEKGKQPIAEQLKAAQREAQAGRGQDTLKRSAPDRGER